MSYSSDDGIGSQDENKLGKVSGIAGLISLPLHFIPILGLANVLIGPFAFVAGLVAIRRRPRGMAIVGIACGFATIAIFGLISVVRL